MCPQCPTFSPAEEPAVLAHVREALKIADDNIEEAITSFESCEEAYRLCGALYHGRTLPPARQPGNWPEETRVRLKEAFETSSLEEYKAFFAPLAAILHRLTDLRTDIKLAGCTGTTAERLYRLREIVPTVQQLCNDFEEERKKFDILQHDCETVSQIGSVSIADDGFIDQYRTANDWAWSLPETQRAVTVGGRSLDAVTFDLLFADPEKVLHNLVEEDVDVGEDMDVEEGIDW
ncbi:hypothetical protein N0V83_001970 [Neocucurbitaria cava]|uniref:Uncharacterized protein n=1 Tax=Neocucurbitaria cava TaxID=798079 RepID=A0A9W8YDG3_9PLEO|nr:hypothetical protein N0V83_001970 [Neocucurbitaria cava]